MKQIEKTASIKARLHKSLGSSADVEGLKVFEAIALNTRPLRKNHPLYRGARAERSLLLEMAVALEEESRPVQIQHDSEPLPIGRVFHGEVVDKGSESELRVLFFLDATASEHSTKIESGTVDQVSVSMLPKAILSSASGFDFLGKDATYENRWNGTDPDGNVLGEKGVYGRLAGLDKWFELSLVGMGGAQNARIVSREQSHFGDSYERLAAAGDNPNALVLNATVGNDTMDLTQLVGQLTDTKVELAAKGTEVETLTAQLGAKDTRIQELETQLAASAQPDAAKDTTIAEQAQTIETQQADLTAAVDALKDVATKVLTAAGKVGEAVPETVAELKTVITETSASLTAALSAGGRSHPAITDATRPSLPALGGFRVRR